MVGSVLDGSSVIGASEGSAVRSIEVGELVGLTDGLGVGKIDGELLGV